MSEEKNLPMEEKKPFAKKVVDKQVFIERKLKAINSMTDKAKAKAIAERVLRNR